MKLSVYAHEVGISYRTAFRWFKSGKIQGRQKDMGALHICEPISAPQTAEGPVKAAIYTRVSAAENKDDLDGQAIRLRDHCAAQGYPVTRAVKVMGSGVNDTRPKLLKLFTHPSVNLIGQRRSKRKTERLIAELTQSPDPSVSSPGE